MVNMVSLSLKSLLLVTSHFCESEYGVYARLLGRSQFLIMLTVMPTLTSFVSLPSLSTICKTIFPLRRRQKIQLLLRLQTTVSAVFHCFTG